MAKNNGKNALRWPNSPNSRYNKMPIFLFLRSIMGVGGKWEMIFEIVGILKNKDYFYLLFN